MKKQFIFCALSIILLVALSGCVGQSSSDGTGLTGNSIIQNESGTVPESPAKAIPKVTKVEIYHFHRTSQCSSCIRLGELAEETVNTYFASEVKAGKVVFGHINIELPENKEIVDRYGPSGSSLYIGTYYGDGSFKKEENVQVWYKIGSRDEYLSYLGEAINRKLTGA